MIKYLWHGSSKKLKSLKPSEAIDLSGHPDSNKKAVYSTDIKELAICFGMSDRSVLKMGEWDEGKFKKMILIKGDIRKGEKMYLYKLDKKDFEKCKGISHQFFSLKVVKPIEVNELNVNDYKSLYRRATKKDKEYFNSLVGRFGG